jgi:hypothetical protein|nr:MAG TPA: periplasmic nitrate reductase [Caudoviricetes sp.]
MSKFIIAWLTVYVFGGLFCVLVGLALNSIIEAITFFSITYVGFSLLALFGVAAYYFINWLNKD